MKTTARPRKWDPALLTFNEEAHEYRYADRVVPSVTTILRDVGLTGPWQPGGEDAEAHMLRGRAVHRAIQLDAAGTLDPATIHEIVRPYFEAWQRFKAEAKPTILGSEQKVYHAVFWYAGTYDLLVQMKRRKILIDIKSGSCPKWAGLQTAAYALCLPRPVRRAVLVLRKDATYRYEPCEGALDRSDFLAAASVWKLGRDFYGVNAWKRS